MTAVTGCSNTYDFEVIFTDQTEESKYSYFWNFGDGTFKLIDYLKDNTQPNIEHTYTSTGTFYPTIELTREEDYEDDPPPSRMINTTTNSSSALSVTINTTDCTPKAGTIQEFTANQYFNIIKSRSPVIFSTSLNNDEGDYITFALQYKNPCPGTILPDSVQISFIYDTDALAFASYFDGFSGSGLEKLTSNPKFHWKGTNGEGTPTVSTSGGQTTIKWTLPDPANDANFESGEVHTLFIYFKVDPNYTDPTFEYDAEVTPIYSMGVGGCSTDPDPDPATSTIADSHDPNSMEAIESGFCYSQGNDRVLFKVNFQNNGDGETKTIKIKSWLDDHIDPASLLVIETSKTINSITSTNFSNALNGDYIEWVLDANLRGTGEPSFLSTDEETKGFIIFSVEVNEPSSKECSAFLAQSEIIFDCNTPIFTNVARVLSTCENGDSYCNGDSTCVFYEYKKDQIDDPKYFTSSGNINKILSDELDLNIDLSTAELKWFPIEGLNTDDPQNPYIDDNIKVLGFESYFLSITEGCQRVILEFPIDWLCDLELTVTPNCTNGVSATEFQVQIKGGKGPYTITRCELGNLCCSKTGAPVKYTIKPSELPTDTKYFYIGVTDDNGCFVEKKIDLRSSPLTVSDDPSDCVANLKISGGIPPYTASWPNPDIGNNIFTGVDLSLAKNRGEITITDANGCVIKFTPQVDVICPRPGLSPEVRNILLLVGGLIVIGVIFAVVRRMNRG